VYSTTSQCLCHSERCANHTIKLAIILTASYLLSSSPCLTCYHPRHVLLTPILVTSYSLSYSPRPTRYRPRLRRPHCHPPHSRHAHRIVLITSCSWRHVHRVVLIASGSSRRVHRVVLIASGSSRRIVFTNFPLFPTLRATLCALKTAAMDVTLGACAGNAKCGSSIYRCTLDIENRTGLSHYAGTRCVFVNATRVFAAMFRALTASVTMVP